MKNKLIILVSSFLFVSGCSCNQIVKKWGGSDELKLPENHILLNMSWRGDNLWILTQDTITHVSYFREKSKWGVLEGSITVE